MPLLQCLRPLVEVLAAVSGAPSAALEANAYLDQLPAAAQSYSRTDARLEGVQEASSAQQHATAATALPLLGVEGAIAQASLVHLTCLALSSQVASQQIEHHAAAATALPSLLVVGASTQEAPDRALLVNEALLHDFNRGRLPSKACPAANTVLGDKIQSASCMACPGYSELALPVA